MSSASPSIAGLNKNPLVLLSLVLRTILLTHASEQTCALKTFSEIEGEQAY